MKKTTSLKGMLRMAAAAVLLILVAGCKTTQGLNRQIRRMCQTLGYNVKSLKRIRVVNIELKNIRSGEYREIKGEELRNLYAKCGMNK